MFSDPRRDQAGFMGPGVSCLTRPPRAMKTRANRDEKTFRGSIARPLISLSTLRGDGYPSSRKTRFRLLARLYRTGLVNRGDPTEDFTSRMILLSRASWRNVAGFPSHLNQKPGLTHHSQLEVTEEFLSEMLSTS